MKKVNKLIVAYLSIGALNEIDRINEDIDCELEIVNEVIAQAEFLDDFWKEHQEVLSEVRFEHDVVEQFGSEFVISDGIEPKEEILKDVLRGVLTKESFNSIYKEN